ncbi:hypothetical protein J3F84DRAFT_364859 [Trichoderma pleuroticola]
MGILFSSRIRHWLSLSVQLEQAYGLHGTGMRASRQFKATPAGNVGLAVSRPAVHGGFVTDSRGKEKKVSNL